MRNDVLSSGVRFTRRRSSRLAGAGTLYSRLNVYAAVLHRRGDGTTAGTYRAQAQRIEEELMAWLNHLSLDAAELEPLAGPSQSGWKVVRWLCDETDAALRTLPAVSYQESIAGILTSTDGKKVRFTEVGDGGIDHELPWGMVESAGLSVGDPALLMSEFTGSCIVTRLQPGFLTSLPDQMSEDATPSEGMELRLGHPLGDEAFTSALFDELRSE
ncbi:hypothetical protein [Streptomyces parvulus]|uniref:hypothetical protein n=1 Tax=Streptomyces parvulus TaxID=146923 RepID=UPI0033BCE670